jgi:hypothetical protein
MKTFRTIAMLVLPLLLAYPFATRDARAQTGESSMLVTTAGGNADLSLFLKRTGNIPWSLGTSSFVFHYNPAAMTFTGLVATGVWSGGNYSATFSAAYSGGTARSIEIEFNGLAGQGTDVPTTPTLLGTLRFLVVNPGASNGLVWADTAPLDACFVSDDSGTDLTGGITFTSPPVGVKEEKVSPVVFSLSQNHPNPWNPSTTIRFGLPRAAFVTLTVYNLLGQRVAELVHEQQPAGYRDIVFRSEGLASGVYFYRIVAGEFVSVKRFVLLK